MFGTPEEKEAIKNAMSDGWKSANIERDDNDHWFMEGAKLTGRVYRTVPNGLTELAKDPWGTVKNSLNSTALLTEDLTMAAWDKATGSKHDAHQNRLTQRCDTLKTIWNDRLARDEMLGSIALAIMTGRALTASPMGKESPSTLVRAGAGTAVVKYGPRVHSQGVRGLQWAKDGLKKPNSLFFRDSARPEFRKIQPLEYSTSLDPYTMRQVGKIICENPVAYKSYQQLNKFGAELKFDFSLNPGTKNAGFTLGSANKVDIFMANNATAREAVSTLVHESTHLQRYSRGFVSPTKYEEYLAFRREFLFQNERRPTFP